MNKKLENAVDMVKVTISICEKHSDLIASVPALNDVFLSLKEKMAEVDSTIKEQISVITGITATKNQSRDKLVQIAFTVAQGLRAFAHHTANVDLENAMHFSFSALAKMTNEILVKTGYNIHAKASEHASEISGFGVNAASLENLLAETHEFEMICHVPREALEIRKTCTHKLETTITEICDLMKNELDCLIRILPDEYAGFKETYKNARAIVNHRGKAKKTEPVPDAV